MKELSGGLADGDIFGWGYTAFSLNPQTQTRSSSEASYLRQALLETTNLLVYKNTIGKQVIFDVNNQATGVVVESGGLSYILNATKEVIISAGAVIQWSLFLSMSTPLTKSIVCSFAHLSC